MTGSVFEQVAARWRKLSLRFGQRESIFWALLATIALAIAVPGGIFSWTLIADEQESVRQAFAAELQRKTELFALTVTEPLWNFDKDSANRLALAFLRDERIVGLEVRDATLGEFLSLQRKARVTRQTHKLEAEVTRNGKRIGRVAVAMDDGADFSVVEELRTWLRNAMIVQFVVAIGLIALTLKYRVSDRLRRLERFSDQLAEGHLDAQLPETRADEIGRLQHHLDQMRLGWRQALASRNEASSRVTALLAEQQAMLDNAVVGVAFIERRTFKAVNAYLEKMLGYGEDEIVGKSTRLLYSTEALYKEIGRRGYEILASGATYSIDALLSRKDGSMFWARLSGHALHKGNPHGGSIWLIEDISARKEAEEQLRLAGLVFESSAEGIVLTDADAKILSVNPAFERITGYSAAEALGKRPSMMQSGRQNAGYYDDMWRALREKGMWAGEIWNKRKDGSLYPEWLTISAARDARGQVTHYVGVFTDITDLKRSEEQLRHMAHHDPLTDLANRALLDDRLDHALRRAHREGRLLAVLFIDLDRFKTVNDTLGHDVGDELLIEIANRLRSSLRDGDTLARLGGDEFVLILEDLDSPRMAGRVAEKIRSLLNEPVNVSGHELFVAGSIGISLYPDDGDDVATLLKAADSAMYAAKGAGRNGYCFYTAQMTESALERLQIEQQLRHALDSAQFRLYYQPQFSLGNGRLIGAEALIRWQHPTLGIVPPDRFIPAAEESGLIIAIGEWVLRESCRQLAGWRRAGHEVPKIAVNVSARQLGRGDLPALVRRVLAETSIPAADLELEVTESVAALGEALLAELNELHAIGVKLAIDDFGTGFSSLAYLGRMPIDILKIDRAFVHDVDINSANASIIRAVVELARGLRVTVLAEGVETEEQHTLLKSFGCNAVQGFLFSKPLVADEFAGQYGMPSTSGTKRPCSR
jgi:diguanylate cyclase (GGDEF)-like protein/PAS domain S-box-containing protein